ncbi:hypothetical protein K438DRAFT_1082636 [Mycena galopus ATCC 62051]|nr:hypothetical protein K438DRAFT_1082636 [Mycena galopus ATCC 62051]
MNVPTDSTAFFTTDLYDQCIFQRLLGKAKDKALQDEITVSHPVMWRIHTNATVLLSGTAATFSPDGQTTVNVKPVSGYVT